jgi:hypothetical protein
MAAVYSAFIHSGPGVSLAHAVRPFQMFIGVVGRLGFGLGYWAEEGHQSR